MAQLWPILFRAGVEIAFAHRPFVWPGRAAVHCVIVGLTPRGAEPAEKRLFSYADAKGEPTETRHAALTAYLFDAGNADRHLVVKEEARPVNGAPRLITGSKPIDGGYLIFKPQDRAAFLRQEPAAEPYLRPFLGAQEYLNGGQRWILTLQDASPGAMRGMPLVRERLRKVGAYRRGEIAASGKSADQIKEPGISSLALAVTPASFHVTVIPDAAFLVIPQVSSERRDYVPIGWLEPPVVPSDKLRVLLDASLWQFGILTSRMHMAWMRQISGRMKSDYMYSVGVVYNSFPWPEATLTQIAAIERLAQVVLDARALPKNATSSLADLYDPDTMPAELRRAHRALDEAVDRLYRRAPFGSDRERVEHLFTLYERIAAPLAAARPKRGR